MFALHIFHAKIDVAEQAITMQRPQSVYDIKIYASSNNTTTCGIVQYQRQTPANLYAIALIFGLILKFYIENVYLFGMCAKAQLTPNRCFTFDIYFFCLFHEDLFMAEISMSLCAFGKWFKI